MQLSPAIAQLQKHANTPRIAFAIKLGVFFVALLITYTIFSDSSSERIDYKQAITSAVKGKKNVFIHNTMANEIDGPFDNSTIVELCARTQWVPGLIFKCEAPEGGVGNVRNVFLNCIRYAIEAGGECSSFHPMFILTTLQQPASLSPKCTPSPPARSPASSPSDISSTSHTSPAPSPPPAPRSRSTLTSTTSTTCPPPLPRSR